MYVAFLRLSSLFGRKVAARASTLTSLAPTLAEEHFQSSLLMMTMMMRADTLPLLREGSVSWEEDSLHYNPNTQQPPTLDGWMAT